MNIIVIVSDTFRWDHLSGICPDSQIETPFIESFTKDWIIFDDHYAGSVPTLPNRTDCFLGKFHVALGGGWAPLRTDLPTLAEMMSEAGYRTQLINSTPHMCNKNNYYQRGFQFHEWIRDAEADLRLCPGNAAQPKVIQPLSKSRDTFDLPGWTLGPLTEWMRGRFQCEEDHVAPKVALAASKWLEWNYRDGPFFLWIDSFDPHEPWIPPEHFRNRFNPDYKGIPMIHPNYGNSNVFTKRELQNLHNNYKAMCAYADKWDGYILQKIEDLGLMDDTMVIFTSDHGIYIGEHNRTGKDNHNDDDPRHWPIYNEVSRIPLAIYHPKMKAGRRIKGYTQPVDMTRTILDAARAKHPKDLHGISLIPQILGKESRGPRKYTVTGRATNNPAVNMGRWLYHPMGEAKKPSLYDLKTDPLCKKNIYPEHPAQAKRLHSLIIKFYRENGSPPELIEAFKEGRSFRKDFGGLDI